MHQNYDSAELAKFAVLASQWWDPQGELKTLHAINPLRLCYIKEKVGLANKFILDVGCGGGILAESLAKENAIVTGIDLNEKLIEVAKLHQLESKTTVEYSLSSVESLADKNAEKFDIITCLEMLEHVPDPFAIVKACATLLKPGGHLFFSTLNRQLKSYLFAILGAEYCLKLLPKNTHDYAKFIKPHELAAWARASNLNAEDFTGIRYNLWNKTFSLTDDLSINYLFYATKTY